MKDTSGHTDRVREGGTAGGQVTLDSGGAFATMQAAFAHAAKVHSDRVRESYYIFAGHSVRVRIVGRKLDQYLGRPFAHLEINRILATAPQLTIDLWDEHETGISCPLASTDDNLGSSWTVGEGVFTGSSDGRFVGYQMPRSITWLDRKAQRIIGWTASSSQLSLYERGKPFRLLLSVWYNDRDVQVIHAGLVSRNGQGVLFPGTGGAGKSTSAIACLCAGFDYLGDDYIGLHALAEGSFVGHSLYNSICLERDHMERFPLLPPHAIHGSFPWEDKSLVLLSDVLPKRLARTAPIRVLALPSIVNADVTRFYPASKAEALLRLAPSSLLAVTPRPGARGFKRLAQLVERIPSYWLELGRDLSQIPQLVEALLAEATRS